MVFCSMAMEGERPSIDVDVGALHLVEELAGVGGEGFDVAALALGVDGVEGERGFAGAGKAGNDRQRVARDFDADVFQVVLARAAHNQFGQGPWDPCLLRSREPVHRSSGTQWDY